MYYPLPPAPPPRSSGGGALLTVAAVFIGLGVVAGTLITQGYGWLGGEPADAFGAPSAALWPILALVDLLGVAAPAGLLWAAGRRWAPDSTGIAATGHAWCVAGLAGGVISFARALPLGENELLLVVTAIAAAVAALVVVVTRRQRGGNGWAGGFGAAAGGLLVLIPWLWLGALGGIEETAAAILAAAATGALAAAVLGPGFDAAFNRSRTIKLWVGGLVAGVALVPIGAGVGGSGVSLALLLTLPALGFAAALLPSPRARAILVGLGAVGPLALLDPEETSVALGDLVVFMIAGIGLAIVAGLLVATPLSLLRRWSAAVVAGVLLVGAGATYAGGGQPGFYGERLFVVLKEQASLDGLAAIGDRTQRLTQTYQRLVTTANTSQADLRSTLDSWHVGYTPYYLVNGLLVDGGPIIRERLRRRDDVATVLIDQRLRPLPGSANLNTIPATEAAPTGTDWDVAMVGADKVWSQLGVTGAGIVIGSSDTGVDVTHPAVAAAFRGGDDSWYDPWNGTTTPVDHNGHGTHTVATALGTGGMGVAPGAQWISCVNLDRDLGSPSRYLDCLQFMLAPFPTGGDAFTDGNPSRAPDILTNSWGCPTIEGCDTASLDPALRALTAAGIFVVVAAGNSGPGCDTITDWPAPDPSAFTVAAVDQSGTPANFSSVGSNGKPDIAAPGVDIRSAVPGGYASIEGTSMATPHVAGVVALLWSAHPELIGQIERTADILRATADPLPNAPSTCGGPASHVGAGEVDAYAAITSL